LAEELIVEEKIQWLNGLGTRFNFELWKDTYVNALYKGKAVAVLNIVDGEIIPLVGVHLDEVVKDLKEKGAIK
jgi:hypothetical protein